MEGDYKWKANRDATIAYVKAHGVSKLLSLTVGADKYWVDSNNVSTGATWSDLNTVKEGTLSYAQLIVKAFNKVAKTPVNA